MVYKDFLIIAGIGKVQELLMKVPEHNNIDIILNYIFSSTFPVPHSFESSVKRPITPCNTFSATSFLGLHILHLMLSVKIPQKPKHLHWMVQRLNRKLFDILLKSSALSSCCAITFIVEWHGPNLSDLSVLS